MKYQQCGCLNKICIMTRPVDKTMRTWGILQAPTLSWWVIGGEREGVGGNEFLSENKSTYKLSNSKGWILIKEDAMILRGNGEDMGGFRE